MTLWRARSSCFRRLVRVGISSRTSRSAATNSARWSVRWGLRCAIAPLSPQRSAERSGCGVLRGECLGSLLRCDRVHPHDLPAVAVQVEEAARVHEAVVLWAIRLAGSRGQGGLGDAVDLIAG